MPRGGWDGANCRVLKSAKEVGKGHSNVELGIQRAGEVLLGFEDHVGFVLGWPGEGGCSRTWDLQGQRSGQGERL